MNEAWAKLVSCDQDVTNVIRWWLVKKAPRHYLRMVMSVGGVREVVQETCLSFIRSKHPDIPYHWSTVAINQTRWTLLRMYKRHTKRANAVAVFLNETLHNLTIPDEQIDIAISKELSSRAMECLDMLSYRERTILELRMEGMTLDEVGQIMLVTKERIRQIEGKAIRKLQQPNAAGKLIMFLDD